MQLDVTWLFDDFTGNKPDGETYRSTYYNTACPGNTSSSSSVIKKANTESSTVHEMTWEDLRKLKVPLYKSESEDGMVVCCDNA